MVSDFGKVILRYTSSQVGSNLIRLLAGLLVVRALEPEDYGLFTGYGIYMGYVLLGHGGIINALGRELPFELGRNNDAYAEKLASSVFVLSTIIGIITSSAYLIIALVIFYHGSYDLFFIFLSYSIIALFFVLNSLFLPTLYRTNSDFDSLSKQNIKLAGINIISVILVYICGLYGLLIRSIIMALSQFLFLFKNKPYKLKFSYDYAHFRKLFHTGWPMFLVARVNQLWNTVIDNVIFIVGGPLGFGLYSLSKITQNAVGIIPNSFSQIIYPRMSISFGKKNSIKKIVKENLKIYFFQVVVIFLISVCGAILLPIIIPIILPKYVNGIAAAQWMMFVPAAQSLGMMNNLYNTIKKQKMYFVSLLIGAISGTAYILIKLNLQGFSIELFPKGLLLGTLIQQILSGFFLTRIVLDFDS